jgi:hypothetical protein
VLFGLAVRPAEPRFGAPLFLAAPRVDVEDFRLAPRDDVDVLPAEPRFAVFRLVPRVDVEVLPPAPRAEEVLRLAPRVEVDFLPADFERAARFRPPVVFVVTSSRSAGSPPITEPIVVSELIPPGPGKASSADEPLRPFGFARRALVEARLVESVFGQASWDGDCSPAARFFVLRFFVTRFFVPPFFVLGRLLRDVPEDSSSVAAHNFSISFCLTKR